MAMEFADLDYLSFAIQSLRPNAEFVFNDADYSTVNWIILDGEPPTLEEINSEIEKIKINLEQQKIKKSEKRQALLNKLGITQEEAQLLLGGN